MTASAASTKRDLLLDTAWSLFCRSGYRAIGIDTVLAEAGVAKMTLYNHFASKEDLIAAALEKKGGEILALLDRLVAAAGPAPQARLFAVFDWLDAWFGSGEFSGCPFQKAIGEFRSEHDKPRQAARAFKLALQSRLESLCAGAGLNSPATLARQLMLVIDGAILHADMHDQVAYAADARAAAQALIAAARA